MPRSSQAARLQQLDGPEPARIAPHSHNPLMDFNHVFYANSADQHKHVCFFLYSFFLRARFVSRRRKSRRAILLSCCKQKIICKQRESTCLNCCFRRKNED